MIAEASKLKFTGFPDKDIYNITAPFTWQGDTVIAGRVEKRDLELSEIHFFSMSSPTEWQHIKSAPAFPGLQDPCVATIDGKTLLGGVRFPVTIGNDDNVWQMEFYLENSQGEFDLVFTGPPKMKDIRFVQHPNGNIGVFTRPQGEKGGRGCIGYLEIDSLENLTNDAIQAAPLFDLCPPSEWVGANEAHILKNGKIGVLGHIANFDDKGNRHYYSMAFAVDPKTGQATMPEIIATRCDFPEGESKRPDLVDVIFSGGIRRQASGQAFLYAGLSDAEAGMVDIADPFTQYEN